MNLLDWFKNFQLRDFYICLLAANVIALGMKWRRLDATFRPFFFLILLALITQAIRFYWNNFNLPGSRYLNFKIYSAGEVLFFGWYFLLLLKKKLPLLLAGFIFPLYIFWVLLHLLYDPMEIARENYGNDAVIGVLVLFFSLAYFYQLIREDDMTSLATHPNFWLSAINMIYYSGISLVSIGISYTVRKGSPEYNIVNDASHYLNLLLYIGYLIIFICFPRKQASSTL